MAVFVDRLRTYPAAALYPRVRRAGLVWCHLLCDGCLEELHGVAAAVGMRFEWFQGQPRHRVPHYDLVPSRRERALRLGAVEATREDPRRIVNFWRHMCPDSRCGRPGFPG